MKLTKTINEGLFQKCHACGAVLFALSDLDIAMILGERGLKLDPKTDIFRDAAGKELTMLAVKTILRLGFDGASDMIPRRWKHVQEEQLEQDEMCLVCFKGDGGRAETKILRYIGIEKEEHTFEDGIVYTLWNNDCWWMPLPVPPEGIKALVKLRGGE